jgi:phosphoglycerol geranylgeranyltransferase
MAQQNVLDLLVSKKQARKKCVAVLIDPDKVDDFDALKSTIDLCTNYFVDFIFIGGSLIVNDNFAKIITLIKSKCDIPVIIFPGNNIQIDPSADAILLLSLISGRNPDMLIGQHVLAAPVLKRSKLEIISTGYILVNSGSPTSASYMSNTTPIPSEKPTIVACTAMAGEMLGQKAIYIDAGSGAENPIPQKVISAVRRSIDIPLIVGGGLNTINKVEVAFDAGADLIVIGNAIEKKPEFIIQVTEKAVNWAS